MNVGEHVSGQTVLLKDRSLLELDGVSDVISFDEGAVLLRTVLGDLTVEGQGLHITRLDLEKGQLSLAGKVSALFYTGESGASKKSGFFARLVK
jgi:sporulation protein YabP